MSRRRAIGLVGAGTGVALNAGPGALAAALPGDEASGALHYLSLQAVARMIVSRKLSPVDLTRHMLDRIAKADPVLKAFATLMPDQAIADARAAEREIASGKYRGPLHGVPVGIKDLCYTKGVRTMGGTAALKDFVPGYDATVVSKLRASGAVTLGKLNLSEGATAPYNPSQWISVSSAGDHDCNPLDLVGWTPAVSLYPAIARRLFDARISSSRTATASSATHHPGVLCPTACVEVKTNCSFGIRLIDIACTQPI